MKCDCKLTSGKRVASLPAKLRPRFFSGLSKAELHTVLSGATHRQFLASSVILHEGDPAERVMLLSPVGQGRCTSCSQDMGRPERYSLRALTPGQVFGGAAALAAPGHYLASTETLSDSCALVWDRKTIREFISRYPKLLDNGLSIAVTEHIAWLISAFVSLTADNAAGRIAHLLVSLACGIGAAGPDGVEIRIGNEDVASGANVTPFTASRILKEWQREGLLTKGRGKLVLHKPELFVTR